MPESKSPSSASSSSSRRQVAPTLELISPYLPARLYELKKDLVRIGRDPDSDVSLGRKDVSWSHVWIYRRSDGFYVEDRGSRNRTNVDGLWLEARRPASLKDGARIRICDNLLVFRREAVKLEESDGGSTVLGVLENLTSIDVVSSINRPDDVLRAVLEINRNLGGTIELNESLGRTLQTLFAIFPESEGGFIVTREDNGELIPRAIRHRNDAVGPLTLSQTAMDQVMNRGKALLSEDSTPSAAGGMATATATGTNSGSSRRNVLCVPLLDSSGQPIGIIQLVSRAGQPGFRPDALDLLAAVSIPIGVTVENNRLLRAKAEWAAAGEIQRSLLPRRQPRAPGYASWEHYEPAREVGGDYYDYIPIEPHDPDDQDEPWGLWAVAVGDVVGKGMPAALLMSSLSSEVRHHIRVEPDPAAVVERLNRHFHDPEFPERFITFLLVLVDAEAHRMTVVNAGHPAPFLRRPSGRVDAIGEDEAGPPLGVDPDQAYQSLTVEIEPGDVVVLYTDGVCDASDVHNRRFGVARTQKTFAQAPPNPLDAGEAILQAVRDHVSGRPPVDDIALVCFGRTP